MSTRRHQKPGTRTLTTPTAAEDDDLVQFCHDAAVRMFQMLDREEAEAGLPDPYSTGASPRRLRKKTRTKKGAVEK